MGTTRIVATVCSLFALAGGVDLAWARGRPVPTPPPTYPAARHWQGFTSNLDSSTSRLYMFGGTDQSGGVIRRFNDLWSYTNAGAAAKWTLISSGTGGPAPRYHVGWSCGDGYCVAANGTSGTSYLKETWVFSEATSNWSQINCKRFTCPSGRSAPTIAYDPELKIHVLFGGDGNSGLLADTFTFDTATKTWTPVAGVANPPARFAAPAVFVPTIHRIVMFGGGNNSASQRLNDMYSWTGTAWEPIAHTTNPSGLVPPFLDFHSMAWDSTAGHLIVTGGLVGASETKNTDTWFVTFAQSGSVWTATWTLASGIGCVASAAAGSPPDDTLHRYAPMAYDAPSGYQVFFGGLEDSPTYTTYGNTVECQ